jgi:hypothetical protein
MELEEEFILEDTLLLKEIGEGLKLKLEDGKKIYYTFKARMVEESYLQENR